MSSKLSQLVATPSPDPDDLMYIVRPVEGNAGSKQITNDNLFSVVTRNIADKTVRFDPPTTAPALSAAGQAALYYSLAQNRLLLSENGGEYRALVLSASQITGANVGQVSPDPSGPVNGDIWYNSSTNQLMARINGVNAAIVTQPGVPRVIARNFTVITSATGLTILHNIDLPPATLVNNGDFLRFTMSGLFGANTNNKQLTLRIAFNPGGFNDVVITPASFPVTGATQTGWKFTGEIVRLGANSYRYAICSLYGSASIDLNGIIQSDGLFTSTKSNDVTQPAGDFNTSSLGLATIANPIPGSTGDITQNITIVELYQF